MFNRFLHICNIDNKMQKGEISIINEVDLHEFNEYDKIDFILLRLDLIWKNSNLCHFYGFEILRYLRLVKKLLLPIVLYSPLRKDFFSFKARKDIKFASFWGRGTIYLELPFKINELKEKVKRINPLTFASLIDMSETLFCLSGYLSDKLNHDLKYSYSLDKLEDVLNSTKTYLNDDQILTSDFDFLSNSILDFKKSKNEERFNSQKKIFLSNILEVLSGKEDFISSEKHNRYKILFIEDDPEEFEWALNNLSNSFDIYPFNNYKKAQDFLKSDISNDIIVIISDWRLYENKYREEWQNMQGYEFLEWAAKNGIRGLFALTSLSDYNVNKIRNYLDIKIHLIKKEYLKDKIQWILFKEIIKEKCYDINNLICSLPKAKGWRVSFQKGQSLHEQYNKLRNSTNWNIFEQTISDKSDIIWQYYKKYLNHELEEALQDFKVKFGIELNKIESILIARRICIGLYFNQDKIYQNIKGDNYPRIDVYCIFRNTTFEEQVNKELIKIKNDRKENIRDRANAEENALKILNRNATGLLTTDLCLDINELPSFYGMLPEEKNWLLKNKIEYSTEYSEQISNNYIIKDINIEELSDEERKIFDELDSSIEKEFEDND
jgi:hypothetical protein